MKIKLPTRYETLSERIFSIFDIHRRSKERKTDEMNAIDVATGIVGSRAASVIAQNLDNTKMDSTDQIMIRVAPSWYSNFAYFDAPQIDSIYCDLGNGRSRVEVIGSTNEKIIISHTFIFRLFGRPLLRVSRKQRLSVDEWLSRKLVLVGRNGNQIHINEDGLVSGVGENNHPEFYSHIIKLLESLEPINDGK
ncbi:hypothetical protein R6242_18925 [Iodobacter sp. CM08]|uniref:hypothetical protein n=1 Tax=Iodobacter sp. CM08 TaxID=3085902 RepID=UPI0029814AFC|nr:hypothetical protein [Iodobacter sp. CM08]MDW5418643.1 hypothetical protein [Iodobacter sp. CM08]